MGKKRLAGKVAAWVVCVLLACSVLPAAAFAGEGGSSAGGRPDVQGSAGTVLTVQGSLAAQASGAPSLVLTRALKTPLVLELGSTYALGAKASSGAKITYISAAPGRVSVTKAGKLKACATGTAAIAVTAKTSSGKTTQRIRVRVVDAADYKAVKSISAKLRAKSLFVGQSASIATTFSPSGASNKNLLFKNLTPKVATVSREGKVTAKATGTAKVRVSSAANPEAACTVSFKVTPKVISKFKDYTWEQLKAISKKIAAAKSDAAGLAIAMKYGLVNADGKLTGAKKSLKLSDGTKASVRILGFRQDKLASGGLAGISFEFATVPCTHEMNEEGTNEGGWALSDMRSWLNSSIYKRLPADLRACIAPAKKRTNNVGYVEDEGDTSAVSTTRDRLWLLSSVEVYGKLSDDGYSRAATYNAEGSQYKLYSDKRVTTSRYSFCEKTGAGSWWWLRSPNASGSYCFRSVDSGGDWSDNGDPVGSTGVSPGFCF